MAESIEKIRKRGRNKRAAAVLPAERRKQIGQQMEIRPHDILGLSVCRVQPAGQHMAFSDLCHLRFVQIFKYVTDHCPAIRQEIFLPALPAGQQV